MSKLFKFKNDMFTSGFPHEKKWNFKSDFIIEKNTKFSIEATKLNILLKIWHVAQFFVKTLSPLYTIDSIDGETAKIQIPVSKPFVLLRSLITRRSVVVYLQKIVCFSQRTKTPPISKIAHSPKLSRFHHTNNSTRNRLTKPR